MRRKAHTRKKIWMATVWFLVATTAAHSQVPNKDQEKCRSAEAAFSDAQVHAAAAYASMDFAKAKAKVDLAKSSLQTGSTDSAQCGCPTTVVHARKASDQFEEATRAEEFEEVQERLYAAIGTAEKARTEAETCWRRAVEAEATKQ